MLLYNVFPSFDWDRTYWSSLVAYKPIRERLLGFIPEVEPVRAKKKIVAKNNRGYNESDWQGKIDYYHPALFTKGYPPDKKIEACAAYTATGSFYRAERMTGVPRDIIKRWSKEAEWWNPVSSGIRMSLQAELDARYTNLLHKAADEIEDRLDHGDIKWDGKSQSYKEVPVTGKEAAVISSILFEKRALLRGDPTSRTERVNTDKLLGELKDEFKKFAQAKTIEGKVITDEEG